MQSISVKLVAVVASLFSLKTHAQLPRECFYVEPLHGPTDEFALLLSDLPQLVENYKPGQRLDKITAYQDEYEENLTALQVSLWQEGGSFLYLSMIGEEMDDWTEQVMQFSTDDQPDRISILTNEVLGVCDVVIYQGKTSTSLSKNTMECQVELEGVEETMIRLVPETPLVGFHGMSNEDGITSLGLILVDIMDPQCQQVTQYDNSFYYLDEMSEFARDEAVENMITQQEENRAKALEAILSYDSMEKARQSKDEIMQQIKELIHQNPIKIHEIIQPKVIDNDLLDVLEFMEIAKNDEIYVDISDWFATLSDHYMIKAEEDFEIDDEKLPVTVDDLKQVYKDVATLDNSTSNEFDGRNGNELATNLDLTILFDTLSVHYSDNYDDISESMLLAKKDDQVLTRIFINLSDYYLDGEGVELNPDASEELWLIFDSLAEAFEAYGQPGMLGEDENTWSPFPLEDDPQFVPSSVQDLDELLGRLEEYEIGSQPMAKTTISDLFQDLTDLYEDNGQYSEENGYEDDLNLPVNLEDLVAVYSHVGQKDHSSYNDFYGRDNDSVATTTDLGILFEKLSEHYYLDEGDFMEGNNDLQTDDDLILVDMFKKLANYYANGQGGAMNPDIADELWLVYDELSNLFENIERVDNKVEYNPVQPTKTIYTKDYSDIEAMYQLIMDGQSLESEFEGSMIQDFNDLMTLERNQKDAKMNKLLTQMYAKDVEEEEAEESLNENFSDIENMMEELEDQMVNNKQMLSEVDKIFREQNNKEIDSVDQSTLEPNALQEKDNEGTIDSVDPSTLAPNALKDKEEEKINWVDPNALKDTPVSFVQKTEVVTEEAEVEMKVEIALEKMIYTFLGVLIIAVIIGTCIGGICVLCVSKCCNRNQKKRLAAVQEKQNFHFRTDSSAIGGTQEGIPNNYNTTIPIGTSPATIETDQSMPENRPQDSRQDTMDVDEEGDVVGKLGGDSTENFGAILSSKGFDFQAAPARRATYSRGRAPVEERQRRASVQGEI